MNLSSLKTALKEGDNKALTIACSLLTPKKIMDNQERYEGLVFELQQTQKSLDFVKNCPKLKSRKTHVKSVNDKIQRLQNELSQSSNMPLIVNERIDNPELLQKNITLLLIDVIKYHKTTEVLAPAEIELLATRIVYQYGCLSVEDVALCFDWAKNGKYGDVFNRVDGNVIMNWLNKYKATLQALAIEKNYQLHVNSKGSTLKNPDLYRRVIPERLRNLME